MPDSTIPCRNAYQEFWYSFKEAFRTSTIFPDESVPAGVGLRQKEEQSVIYGQRFSRISGYMLGKFFFYNTFPVSMFFLYTNEEAYNEEQCARQQTVENMRYNGEFATRRALAEIKAPNVARDVTEVLVRAAGWKTAALPILAYTGFAAGLESIVQSEQALKKSEIHTVDTAYVIRADDASGSQHARDSTTYVLKP